MATTNRRNYTIPELIDRLENYYVFECEGGPLKNCVEWQTLRSGYRAMGSMRVELAQLLNDVTSARAELEHERTLLNALLLDCVEILHGVLRCRHCLAFVDAAHYNRGEGIAHEPDCVVGQIIQERA